MNYPDDTTRFILPTNHAVICSRGSFGTREVTRNERERSESSLSNINLSNYSPFLHTSLFLSHWIKFSIYSAMCVIYKHSSLISREIMFRDATLCFLEKPDLTPVIPWYPDIRWSSFSKGNSAVLRFWFYSIFLIFSTSCTMYTDLSPVLLISNPMLDIGPVFSLFFLIFVFFFICFI